MSKITIERAHTHEELVNALVAFFRLFPKDQWELIATTPEFREWSIKHAWVFMYHPDRLLPTEKKDG